jgi:hypothetical protein
MMRRLIGVLLLALAGLAGAQTPLTGDWVESDFVGVNRVSDECQFLNFATRTISFAPLPGGALGGSFATYEQSVWIVNAKVACKFPTKTMIDVVAQRTRVWPFALKKSGDGGWTLGSGPADCVGDSCDQAFVASFETTLQLKDDILYDLGDGTAQARMAFRRVDVARERAEEAEKAVQALLRRRDSGDCNGYFLESLSRDSSLRARQADFCMLDAQWLQTEKSPILHMKVISRIALSRSVSAGGPVQVDDVLLTGFAEYQDGSVLPRDVILRRDPAGWRVLMTLGR